jgi:hypothetical protein
VVNGVPQPARVHFFAHIESHLIQLCAQPTPPIKLVRTTYLYLHVFGRQVCQYGMIHLVDLR